MDQEKIGKFILSLRKKNNLTQKQLADKLNVTSQAVSKWENGRGIPDIEILNKLSKEWNVDIESIINGTTKKKNNIKKIILPTIIFILLFIIIIFLFANHKDFEFSNLKSENKEFIINGVAAYSKDKKSIYISNIEYKNTEDKKYIASECILYESSNNIDKKISQYGKINYSKNYKNKTPKKLEELLKSVKFNIDDYKSSCRNLKNSNLFISINLKDTSNSIVSYKIPIKLEDSCK